MALNNSRAPAHTIHWSDSHSLARRHCLRRHLNAAATRPDANRLPPKSPLRDHVAHSVRRYLRDLDGSAADDIYKIVLREMEIPLFVEVLNFCEGNQSRAAALLGIHRATLRKKLREYGLS